MAWLLGLDLGGTEVKCGAFSTAGDRLASRVVPTRDGEMVGRAPAFVIESRQALASLASELGGPPDHIGCRGSGPCLAGRHAHRLHAGAVARA